MAQLVCCSNVGLSALFLLSDYVFYDFCLKLCGGPRKDSWSFWRELSCSVGVWLYLVSNDSAANQSPLMEEFSLQFTAGMCKAALSWAWLQFTSPSWLGQVSFQLFHDAVTLVLSSCLTWILIFPWWRKNQCERWSDDQVDLSCQLGKSKVLKRNSSNYFSTWTCNLYCQAKVGLESRQVSTAPSSCQSLPTVSDR